MIQFAICLVVLGLVELEKIMSGNLVILSDIYYSVVKFGESGAIFFLEIDLLTPFIFLPKLPVGFESKIEKEKLKIGLTKELYGVESQIKMTVPSPSITFPDMNLYLSEESFTGVNSLLGLGFSGDSKFSFMHKLYNEEKIDNLRFGLDKKSSNLVTTIYYGGFPENITKGQDKVVCQVNNVIGQWGCMMDKIDYFFEKEQTFFVGKYVYFQTKESKIKPDKDFLHFLNVTIFNKYFEEKTCIYEKFGNKTNYYCDCKVVKHFSDFKFVIKKKVLIIKREALFEEKHGRCSFIFEDDKSYNKLIWVFGSSFIGEFKSLFDYKAETITFYSDKVSDYQEHTKTSTNHLKIYMNIILILLVIGIHNHIIFFLKNKNR